MDKKGEQSQLPEELRRLMVTEPIAPTAPDLPFRLPSSAATEQQPERGLFISTSLPPISTFDRPPGPSSLLSSSSSFHDSRLPPVSVRREPQHIYQDTRQIRPPDHFPPPYGGFPTSDIARSTSSHSLPGFPSNQAHPGPLYGDPHHPHNLANRPERFLHDPPQSYSTPPELYPRSSLQDQEAGPSSLAHVPFRELARRRGRGRRGSSQPVQTSRQVEPFSTSNFGSDGEQEGSYGERGREDYSGHPTQPYSSWPGSFPRESVRLDLVPSQSQITGYHAPPVSSYSGWAAPSGSGHTLDHPPGYSPSSLSDGSSDGRPEDEGDETYTTGKKRRSESIAGDDTSKKGRSARKTAVACNFCRGRKLRCNGAKPACSNCVARKFQCEYVPVQRRRGPGKAPKGTRSKKGTATAATTTGRSEASISVVPSDRTSGMMPEALMLRTSMDTVPFPTAVAESSGVGPSSSSSAGLHDRSSRARGTRTRTSSVEEKRTMTG